MSQSESYESLWGIGLEPEWIETLQSFAGKEFPLKNFPPGELPDLHAIHEQDPLVVFIPMSVWADLDTEGKSLFLRHDTIQRVLVLDGPHPAEELELALDTGFLAILKLPFSKPAVLDALSRAIEIRSLYMDIYRMTQEISLERELLARKNKQLEFLNRFLSRVTETLDPVSILTRARRELRRLLPVGLLQAAVWDPEKIDLLEVELFIAEHKSEQRTGEWVEFILESATRLSGRAVHGFQISTLGPVSSKGGHLAPIPGQVMVLPLLSGQVNYGCLVLSSPEGFNLGRDQVQILHSAMSHLGLAMRNGVMFRQVKTLADFDGLTRLANRRSLEMRLPEEMRRHLRYKQWLTLLMLDLDHFKKINDLHGHQVGDEVLKQVGAILRQTVRTTDFAARYGGEEFLVVLPQTDEDQARILAERLLHRIRCHRFEDNGKPFTISASIGIASLKPESVKSQTELLREADVALYAAKTCGRDTIVASGDKVCPSLDSLEHIKETKAQVQ